MPRSPDEQRKWEEQCYGCSIDQFKTSVENSVSFKCGDRNWGMVAMSLLSDAQEEIAHEMRLEACQTINRAKWVISTYLSKSA